MFGWPYVWDCSGTKLNLHGVLSRHRLRRGAHSAVSLVDNYEFTNCWGAITQLSRPSCAPISACIYH